MLLRLLLFWSMFVPLGAPPQPAIATCGSAALVLQIVLMYACAAATKSGDAWWGECSAVHDALQLDLLVTPLGEALRRWAPPPLLCARCTHLLQAQCPLLRKQCCGCGTGAGSVHGARQRVKWRCWSHGARQRY